MVEGSHPTRMRGLKLQEVYYDQIYLERRIPRGCVDWNHAFCAFRKHLQQSHPTRMRGLKSLENYITGELEFVASHADAWIEIAYKPTKRSNLSCRIPRGCVDWNFLSLERRSDMAGSHPTRMRGLKFTTIIELTTFYLSHPTRMRGLKSYTRHRLLFLWVSHPTRMRGLKSVRQMLVKESQQSHPTRMRGLKY